MSRSGYIVGTLCLLSLALWPVEASQQSKTAVARGEYLANSVAMCVQCHSPRAQDGTLEPGQQFRGGRIPVDPPAWQEAWAITPPDLVAMAHARPDRIISVLTTGKRHDGTSPRPPMPPFRFAEQDAQAVVAYLQSLDVGR